MLGLPAVSKIGAPQARHLFLWRAALAQQIAGARTHLARFRRGIPLGRRHRRSEREMKFELLARAGGRRGLGDQLDALSEMLRRLRVCRAAERAIPRLEPIVDSGIGAWGWRRRL